jgi:hypothetical protein
MPALPNFPFFFPGGIVTSPPATSLGPGNYGGQDWENESLAGPPSSILAPGDIQNGDTFLNAGVVIAPIYNYAAQDWETAALGTYSTLAAGDAQVGDTSLDSGGSFIT